MVITRARRQPVRVPSLKRGNHIDALLQSAIQQHQAGDLRRAEAGYRSILDRQPDHPDALNLLGAIAVQVGQLAHALDFFERATAAAPDNAAYQSNLGVALAGLGRGDEAVAAFNRALVLDPAQPEALEGLAEIRAASRRHHLQMYQAHVMQTRQTPYLEYPQHVHLETVALCSAACTFCPYARLTRKGTRMPDELISKILDDLTAIPTTVPFVLSPFKVNDPFLDPRLLDILRQVNQRLPQAGIALTTNGSALTEAKLEQLTAIENVQYLWFSVNDHRPTEYEATMSLPFDRLLKRLDMVAQHQAAGRLGFPVYLSRVGDGSPDDDAFLRWCAEAYPEFTPSLHPRGNWLGQVDAVVPDVPDVGCQRWFELSITATGVVAHCCMDGEAQFPIGNVRERHVLEVYNDPAYRRLREHTVSRRDVSPCNGCTFL